MNDIKAEIRDAILADTVLVEMLALNNDPYNKDVPQSKRNAVVDYLNGSKMTPVFITLRGDTTTLVGAHHLTNAFILVRCYNEKDKTFFTINEVMSRVQKLLNGRRFTVAGYATVETVWETTTGELLDEGYDLNYREARFRIQLT